MLFAWLMKAHFGILSKVSKNMLLILIIAGFKHSESREASATLPSQALFVRISALLMAHLG